MKKRYFFGLIVFSLLAIVGCEDLDTYPQGDIITSDIKVDVNINDPEKAVAAVNGIFAQFNTYMPNRIAFNDVQRHNDFGYPSVMLFTDANGNDVVSTDNGYNWMGSSLEFYDRTISSYECQIVWNDMYAIISAANRVVGAIDEDTDDPLSMHYLAQGLSVRAYSYFILAQLYQFNYVGNQGKPCVPIITPENSDFAALNGAPRATVGEVYDLINTDLGKAITLLTSAEEGGAFRSDKRYISLAVAYGIRARVNLTMDKKSEAVSDAEKAIANFEGEPAGLTDVNVPSFMSIEENNWMWGIPIAETDRVVTSGIVNWISHMGSLNSGYAQYSMGFQINKALFNSINTTDIRKGWWLNEDTTSVNLNAEQLGYMHASGFAPYTQVKFAPYDNVVANSTNANDIPLMRVEEMYLIKAEAQGEGAGKATLENFIKTYRDPGYTYSASDFTQEVFRHRRIELWGEGLNWYDIMRLNVGVDRRGGGYPNATMVFHIEPDDNILLWRLPEAEIEANVALTPADNNPPASAPEPVEDID